MEKRYKIARPVEKGSEFWELGDQKENETKASIHKSVPDAEGRLWGMKVALEKINGAEYESEADCSLSCE